MVEPYISMASPSSTTPTLTASAPASVVPQMTGVPAARPVSAAAAAVTYPTTWVVEVMRGKVSLGQTRRQNSSFHSMVRGSSIGTALLTE